MMEIKSIISTVRNLLMASNQAKQVTVRRNPENSSNGNPINVSLNEKNNSRLLILPTPYTLPIVMPIRTNEKNVMELMKDHYYVIS
ncbi:hypothetical protein [Vulcanisaeta souniana]|nr:hypothetical protein [Vulcanisaeta souniana]